MKTSELTGAALDWAVAKCDGVELLDPHNNEWEVCWVLLSDGTYYSPSSNWSQGGPIIERERIGVGYAGSDVWDAGFDFPTETGPTPLIAAMRCYCSATLGDEIEVPKELL